ncbi:MAG: SsgA family sporulation/cell division regulator [Acidothermus sp.]|nr:SsgA family sporulation/cell division regulator [Acidothermus sp.]MCL6537110.1 SsgA family sporulation/cell division regulator [Acidothermus sp.]
MRTSVHIIEITEFELLSSSALGDRANMSARHVLTQLRYDPSNPYAVVVRFITPSGTVEWVISRDLLAEGVHRPVGDGDVHLAPDGDRLRWTLRSPSGTAVLAAPLAALGAFVADTERIVPRGTEHRMVDLDAEIARLLRGGPPGGNAS